MSMSLTWYAIARDVDGGLVSVGTVIDDPLPAGLIAVNVGATPPTGTWNPATRTFEDFVPVADASAWQITKFAFRSRFTQAEKVTIEIASLDNPTAPMEQRELAAGLRAAQADQRDAAFIDLVRADTRAGVIALETAGLLAAGRAAEILDTPSTYEERYRP